MSDVVIAAAAEAQAEAHTEQQEIASEAAIETAEIAAERDVEIATVQAEAAVAQTEAQAEAIVAVAEAEAEATNNGELEECRKQIAELATTVANLGADVSLILTKLTPAEPLPQSPPSVELASGEVTLDNPVVHEEPPAEPARKPKRFHRLI
jgi:hypothetical protein